MGIGDWIAIIGIIVMIAIAIWQNTRKVVAYKILSDPAEYKYNTVLLKGESLLVIKIQNIGKAPITMDDFYQGNPIVFEFGKGTEIVQAEVVETIPDGIAAEVKEKLTFGSGKLTIAPLLLNRYSFIKLKVKLAHFNGEVHAGHMQIVGGKLINFDEYFINKIVRNPTHNPIITIFHLILAALIFCAFAPLLLLPAYLGLSLVASVLNTSLDAATDTLPGGIAFLAGLIIGLYCLSKLSRFIDLFFNFRGKIKLF